MKTILLWGMLAVCLSVGLSAVAADGTNLSFEDGSDFILTINGAMAATLHAVGTPAGTVRFQVKATTGRFEYITVQQ